MANTLDEAIEALITTLNAADLNATHKTFAEALDEFSELPEDDGLEDDDIPDNNPPTSNPSNSPSQPLTIPKLPPGTTLDLTLPTINIPNYPEFSIPAGLGVDASTIIEVDPLAITLEQWMVIAKRTEVLLAYMMGEVTSDPQQAKKAALDWMVPETSTFVSKGKTGEASTAVVYSEQTASYVKAGFDKQSASFGCPFVAASFERESKEKLAQASHRKSVIMIGRWVYPRVTLRLEQCTKLSARFTDELAKALSCTRLDDIKTLDPTKVTQEQLDALLKVFKTYGVAVPEEVDLGGVLNYSSIETCEGALDEKEAEKTIKVAAEAKYEGVTASAGIGFGLGEKKKITAEFLSKNMKFTATGGETLLADSPKAWVSTVAPPEKWAVIAVRGLKPLVEWLDPETRDKLKQIWAYAQPAIGPLQEVDTQDRVLIAVSGSRFVLAARRASENVPHLGRVKLACATSTSPELGRDAVGGEVRFHKYGGGKQTDRQIDRASLCLPVPPGYRCAFAASDEVGKAQTRLTIVDTQLTFGDWKKLSPTAGQTSILFTADTDGFVFGTISAPSFGDRGHLYCYQGKDIHGAASVHYGNDNHIKTAAVCVPFPKGSQVGIVWLKDAGNVQAEVWWLPSTSQYWSFKTERLSLNTRVPAATDGFASVWMSASEGRGFVRIESISPDTQSLNENSAAAAAVQDYKNSDEWIRFASVMVPIRKGFDIWSEAKATAGSVQFTGYWTAIVPRSS